MKYDFETVQMRKNVGSGKWNWMYDAVPDLSDDVIPFSVADMEFKNVPEISNGVAEYVRNAVMGYTLPTDSYYEAVAGWMKRKHDWDVKKDWILEYPGVVPALFHIVRMMTEPGDGVIDRKSVV